MCLPIQAVFFVPGSVQHGALLALGVVHPSNHLAWDVEILWLHSSEPWISQLFSPWFLKLNHQESNFLQDYERLWSHLFGTPFRGWIISPQFVTVASLASRLLTTFRQEELNGQVLEVTLQVAVLAADLRLYSWKSTTTTTTKETSTNISISTTFKNFLLNLSLSPIHLNNLGLHCDLAAWVGEKWSPRLSCLDGQPLGQGGFIRDWCTGVAQCVFSTW